MQVFQLRLSLISYSSEIFVIWSGVYVNKVIISYLCMILAIMMKEFCYKYVAKAFNTFCHSDLLQKLIFLII